MRMVAWAGWSGPSGSWLGESCLVPVQQLRRLNCPVAVAALPCSDIGLHVGKNFVDSFPERVYVSNVFPLLVEAKRLGEKSGSGFYKVRQTEAGNGVVARLCVCIVYKQLWRVAILMMALRLLLYNFMCGRRGCGLLCAVTCCSSRFCCCNAMLPAVVPQLGGGCPVS